MFQKPIRKSIDFNSGWKFLKLCRKGGLCDLPIEKTSFYDDGWQEVTLPHTWNSIDGADGWSGIDEGGEHYYRGLGGYRKTCYLGKEFAGKRIFIEFRGANTVTKLYVNEKLVGTHEGGYSAFRFDITDHVILGGNNVFAVKVNNAPSDYIAPITNQGDFTKMGGIYRKVCLKAVEPLHIDLTDYGSSGVYVTPQNISPKSALINVLVKLANDASSPCNAVLGVSLIDAHGNSVANADLPISLSASQKTSANVLLSIDNPKLWNGTSDPYLYTARVTLSANGTVTDEVKQNFGIRTYHVDAQKGFFLNGEYLDLRGVCYHQDSYENGWAMTDAERERDFAIMREMGANAVRMAHYQHDGYEYDLCDRLGMCVWTEIGIVNKVSADESDGLKISEGFVDNAEQQLKELIRQNYNHPSVIIWGISNELFQMNDEIYNIYCSLNRLAKQEDETRLVSFADSQFCGRFLELPADIVGYNRYFGWYIDGADEAFGKWLDQYHTQKEKRPIGVTEYGGGGAVSQHKDGIVWSEDIDFWGKRHYENYQSAMHEYIWSQFAKRQYLWGKFVWCMFDFASDGREEGDTKGENDKGLVTRNRIPKDSYFFYKSVWNDAPTVHLTEKRFTERIGKVPKVKAYCNAESAELFVNGISVGKVFKNSLSPESATVFVWENVDIGKGEKAEIKVVAAFNNGITLSDTAYWTGI